ncbi:SDR family NAD(P)-dependent oxidoreductase [Benzoatithermus flavus]|uniref:SDR family NAD(P)-dependent oxidoreductase n=1 Tax=Benzoatithermus flavus TaxID=3108223 RepID=A0ABU8XXL1_9PROT
MTRFRDKVAMVTGGGGGIGSAICTRLADEGAHVIVTDFLVEVNRRNRYCPDVSVARGETRDFTDRSVLIVEVLSPGTQREDLGPKLQNHLRTPGLWHVLYLWQDEPRARLYAPEQGADAEPRELAGLDAVIDLPGPGIGLSVAELCRDVAIP